MTKKFYLELILLLIALMVTSCGKVFDNKNKNKAPMESTSMMNSMSMDMSNLESIPRTNYSITITNGSQMPLSPGLIYVKNDQNSETAIGKQASANFVTLCQTGKPTGLINELKSNVNVISVTETTGPILPGNSITVNVSVPNPKMNGLHFLAMYGLTKDTCSSISLENKILYDLYINPSFVYSEYDKPISTGAFTDPSANLNPDCSQAASAVACLRLMSQAVAGPTKIRSFSPYLPSVYNFLATRPYADSEIQALVLTDGEVAYSIKVVQ